MIKRLDINGVHVEIEGRVEKYIQKKIGRLDRFLPRHAKKSAHARVILSQDSSKQKLAICEVVLELPQSTIAAKEATANMFSSIDIVESKLARQIRKYKTAHATKRDRHILHRLLGRVRGGR